MKWKQGAEERGRQGDTGTRGQESIRSRGALGTPGEQPTTNH
ncbi:hypothetical protein [Chlorogloeopsis fritschii]|nr:hypothetical protein [Chlorogloeopsis fritschii]